MPKTSSIMTNMVAKTGRLMQISASFCMRLAPSGEHRRAVDQHGEITHGDRLTGAYQVSRDFNPAVHFVGGREPHLAGLAVAQHENLSESSERVQSLLGHYGDFGSHLRDETNFHEHAGPQAGVGAVDARFHHERTRLGIERWIQLADGGLEDDTGGGIG